MPEIFEKVTEWVKKLDGVREELEEQIFIYFVENAKAIDIGDIIRELYGEKRRDKKTRTTRTKKKSKKTKSSRVSKSRTGLATVAGEIKVVVDEVNNAILVRATPQDYAQVLKTIKVLDIIPKQVLIEVLIAEVTLDDNTEFGLEWSIANDYASLGGYKGTERAGQNLGMGGLGLDLLQPIAQSGFTYAFASQGLVAFLRAYARENKVDILSSPHILAADNTEATIEVGKEVPIVTSEYTPQQLASETSSFSRSIEYRDTGILLRVTPRINEKGLVTMEVSQEVSDVSEQRIEGINSPIILKRKAETTLVVQDGMTIVIGGLIREKVDYTKEGIPYLLKIPYLGMLFSYNREVREKTELLILITPHVINTFEEAALITREFEEKLKSLKRALGK
jgi:general secretion pathway protein D